MSQRKADDYVEVELELDELDSTTAANLEKLVSQGMPKSEDSRQPQCPVEKGARGPVDLCFARTEAERRQAIRDALEHLGMV